MTERTDPQKVRTVEFAPIGIWKLSTALTVTEVNQAVCSQLGEADRSSIVGRNIHELMPFLPDDLFYSIQHSHETAKHQFCSTHDPNKLMPTYWDVTVGKVLEADTHKGYVMSTMEVTEHERLLQQREDFISALAHNLKAPLIGADRTLESMLAGALGQLTDQQSSVLDTLKRSNLGLLGMVQDLIEVYRYDTNSANLTFETLNLGTIAKSCTEELQKKSRSRLVNVRCSSMSNIPEISADRNAIKRMIFNLLDNSLDHTPTAGLIEITAEASDRYVVVKVKDNGIGMGVDDPEKLFGRFWQGVPGKSYTASAGLGLYLCRQIATAHGGQISISAMHEAGTTISIKLPITQDQASR